MDRRLWRHHTSLYLTKVNTEKRNTVQTDHFFVPRIEFYGWILCLRLHLQVESHIDVVEHRACHVLQVLR